MCFNSLPFWPFPFPDIEYKKRNKIIKKKNLIPSLSSSSIISRLQIAYPSWHHPWHLHLSLSLSLTACVSISLSLSLRLRYLFFSLALILSLANWLRMFFLALIGGVRLYLNFKIFEIFFRKKKNYPGQVPQHSYECIHPWVRSMGAASCYKK
jgi:hypothetical protein